MRISSSQIAENSLIAISRAYERFTAAQERVSTGRQLNKPSDDPAGLQQALGYTRLMDNIDQFRRNIDYAHGFLGATDSALGEATTALRQARTLAIQGASDTVNVEARTGLASQVADLIDQLHRIGNSTHGSRYLFGGQRTTQPPFVGGGGSYTYQGGTAASGDDKLFVEVAEGDQMVINVTGDRVFTDAMATLTALRDHIATGQISIISRDDLVALDKALETVLGIRAEVGGRVQRLEQTLQQLELTRLAYAESLSKVVDADLIRATLDMRTAETTYQAALAASVRGFQQSLLDFLR